MYEKLTARLDESYTVLGTAQRITRIRVHTFTVVPEQDCTHGAAPTICAVCADDWQTDYEFDDPFPFARPRHRWTLRDFLDAGALRIGDTLTLADSGITAQITSTGGLMLPDGRIFDNSSAAANAALTPDNPTN